MTTISLSVSPVIDKLTVGINDFCPDFYHHSLLPLMRSARVSTSRYYASTVDLRSVGKPVLLHVNARLGTRSRHKIELLETGTMVYSEIIRVLSELVPDPQKGRIMGIDFAADVLDFSVAWFRSCTRVAKKQYSTEFDVVRVQRRQGEVQTIEFGRRSTDLIRIYDKDAQQRKQFHVLVNRASGDCPRSFEQTYGHAPGIVLTRVERRCVGRRVPEDLGTVGDLRNAARFEPFAPLRFIFPERCSPEPVMGSLKDFIISDYILRMIAAEGMQNTIAWLNRYTNRNASRWVKRYCSGIVSPEQIPAPDLQAIYQQSVLKQLAA